MNKRNLHETMAKYKADYPFYPGVISINPSHMKEIFGSEVKEYEGFEVGTSELIPKDTIYISAKVFW